MVNTEMKTNIKFQKYPYVVEYGDTDSNATAHSSNRKEMKKNLIPDSPPDSGNKIDISKKDKEKEKCKSKNFKCIEDSQHQNNNPKEYPNVVEIPKQSKTNMQATKK